MIDSWIKQYEGDPDFEFDLLAIDIGERIVERMEQLSINRTELAAKIGVSKARISQILRGHDNLTLKSLVAVAIGLESRIEIRLKNKETDMVQTPSKWLPFATRVSSKIAREPSSLADAA